MKKASSWQLLFANPIIFVPWLANILVMGLIQHFTTTVNTIDGAPHSSPFWSRYIIIASFLTAAYSTCMAQLIWNNETITFSKANHIFMKSIRRILIAASISFICVLVIPPISNPESLATPLILILIVTVFFFAFFSTYWIAAVVVGDRGIIDGFLVSAKLVSQKPLRTLTLYITPILAGISLLFVEMVLVLCHVLSHSNMASASLLYFFVLLPTVVSYNIAMVGEYCASYDSQEIPRQSIVEKRVLTWVTWGRRIVLAIIIFCFLAVLLFVQLMKLMRPHLTSTSDANIPIQQATVADLKRNDRLAHERITQFIEKSRSILGSRFAEKNAINSAYSMVLPNSEAYAYLEGWYPQHNPFRPAFHETDQVRVRTIQAVIPNVYRVQWSEHISDKRGKLMKFQVWEGTISIAQPSALISSIMWSKKSDIRYEEVRPQLATKANWDGDWRLSPEASYGGFREFGGPPYCRYAATLAVQQLSLRMRKTQITSATLQIRLLESAAACPYPQLPASDQSYALLSQVATRTTVDLTFLSKSENQERSRAYLHLMKRANGTLSGTLVFHRVDSAPILNWTIPISIVMEPGLPLPKSDWKSVSLPSQKAQFITDALGTHIIPLGFQEKSGNPGLLFRTFGLSVATMQNPSTSTQIMLFGMKNTNVLPQGKELSSRQLRSCSSVTPLPDDAFNVGNLHQSFQRFSCTASEGTHTVQMEVETGNFLVGSPVPHRIVFTALGLQQAWNPNAIHELVRSFQ